MVGHSENNRSSVEHLTDSWMGWDSSWRSPLGSFPTNPLIWSWPGFDSSTTGIRLVYYMQSEREVLPLHTLQVIGWERQALKIVEALMHEVSL